MRRMEEFDGVPTTWNPMVVNFLTFSSSLFYSLSYLYIEEEEPIPIWLFLLPRLVFIRPP